MVAGLSAPPPSRMQRYAAQRGAAPLDGEHVLQHLVDHGDMGETDDARRPSGFAPGVEARIEDETACAFSDSCARPCSQAAQYGTGEVPPATCHGPAPIEHGVGRFGSSREHVARSDGTAFELARRTRREEDHRARSLSIEQVRFSFREMDGAFNSILAGNVRASARRRLTRCAPLCRAREWCGPPPWQGRCAPRTPCAAHDRDRPQPRLRCQWRHRPRSAQVRRARHIDGIVDIHGARALQVEQTRLFGIGQACVHARRARTPPYPAATGSRKMNSGQFGRSTEHGSRHGPTPLAPQADGRLPAAVMPGPGDRCTNAPNPSRVDEREARAPSELCSHQAFERIDHRVLGPRSSSDAASATLADKGNEKRPCALHARPLGFRET